MEPSSVSRSSGRVSGLDMDLQGIGQAVYSGSEAHEEDLVHPGDVYHDENADQEGGGGREIINNINF
jgi:hypothetical protein